MPTMLAISGQLYWMIVTNHWMGAVYGSVWHLARQTDATFTHTYINSHIFPFALQCPPCLHCNTQEDAAHRWRWMERCGLAIEPSRPSFNKFHINWHRRILAWAVLFHLHCLLFASCHRCSPRHRHYSGRRGLFEEVSRWRTCHF